MRAVARFEYNLLRILHCFLRHVPVEQVRTLIVERWNKERPPCLARPAVELVQDALAKGCTALLAGASGWRREGFLRGDGWRRERFLRGDHPREGRLWERTPPQQLGLPFSRHSLDFLMWVAAGKPTESKGFWHVPDEELTVGDRLLLFLAYEALRSDPDISKVWRQQPQFTRHALCRLAFPEDFAVLAPPGQEKPTPPLDYGPWTGGLGACILEAFQHGLAARWVEVEHSKGEVLHWQALFALGRSQEQALTVFLDATAAAQRYDLARCVLMALAQVLTETALPRQWVGGLQTTGPRMVDRMETNRAALVLVRQVERLQQWAREARRLGYFDEGYARAQLWLADWERFDGTVLVQRATALQQQLDPLRQSGPQQPPSEPNTPPAGP